MSSENETEYYGVHFCHDCQWCDNDSEREVEWNDREPTCPNCGGYAYAY